MMKDRTSTLRRYPALGFLAVAAALALLLPSRLSNPRSDPAALAEFAPVPGDSEGRSDLSDLGQAGYGTLGSGSAGLQRATPAPVDASGPGGGRKGAPTKRCVGTPARQTEDLMSPPCVASFIGDNGGATTRGVTKDEIAVVLILTAARTGEEPGYEDMDSPRDAEDTETGSMLPLVGKVYAKFFNDRYQTYGRHVRLWKFDPHGDADTDPAVLRAAIERIDSEKRPFAIVPVISFAARASQEAASRSIFSASYLPQRRSGYAARPPYMTSYLPDLDDQAKVAGSYICSRLAGSPARFSVSQRLSERAFGTLYSRRDSPNAEVMAGLLRDELRLGCNVDLRMGPGGSTQDFASSIARLRSEGVTSVVTLLDSGDRIAVTNLVGNSGWEPEWIIPGSHEIFGADRTSASQTSHASVVKNSFGITFDQRRAATSEQPFYTAWFDACPDCPAPTGDYAPRIYDTLSLLFYGIQTAGPRLTPESFDRGLHSLPPVRSTDPYRPAAYFAPGNYSFIKDAMEIWWDGSATPPGGQRPGCFKLPRDGARDREGWPKGDEGLFADGTCQGPV